LGLFFFGWPRAFGAIIAEKAPNKAEITKQKFAENKKRAPRRDAAGARMRLFVDQSAVVTALTSR
jgi:hypothetical protein